MVSDRPPRKAHGDPLCVETAQPDDVPDGLSPDVPGESSSKQ